MVAQLARLRLALLANLFKRRPGHRLVIGFFLFFAAAAIASCWIAASWLRTVDPVTMRAAAVLCGSAIVLASVVVPIIRHQSDVCDPRRFVLFGIRAPQLARAIFVTSFLGPAEIILVLAAASFVFMGMFGLIGGLLAVFGSVLAVLTCVLAKLFFTSLSAFVLSTRRSREIGTVVAFFLCVMAVPLAALLVTFDRGQRGSSWVDNLVQNIGWTPLGAAWSIPAEYAVTGDWFLVGARCFVAVASVVLLWLGWRFLVSFLMFAPERHESASDYAGKPGWFTRVPSTASGAIAARSLTYWMRDPRYFVGLIIVPIIPILMTIPLFIVGVPVHYLAVFPIPIMALFLGFAVHNDLAFDHSAVWLHIVTGKHGFADRIGRIVPALFIGLPMIGVGSVISIFLVDKWVVFPDLLGISICLLLSSLGLGSIISARFPYPVTRPGESPFTHPQSTGAISAVVPLSIIFGALLCASPSIFLAIYGEIFSLDFHGLTALLGLASGLFFLVLGVFWGGKTFNRRQPEILASALQS